jgi:hypothetical protein
MADSFSTVRSIGVLPAPGEAIRFNNTGAVKQPGSPLPAGRWRSEFFQQQGFVEACYSICKV